MGARSAGRTVWLVVATASLALALVVPAVAAQPPRAPAARQAPASGGPCAVAGRSLVSEFGGGGSEPVYVVPQGEAFVVTDVIALREGNADTFMRVLADGRAAAIVPLVGIDSNTDLYGVHLETGIRFESGQTITLSKDVPGYAWVTIVGYATAP